VARPDPANLLGPTLVGNALILAAASSVALGTVLVRWSHHEISVVAFTGWAMVVGATLQFVISVALGESLADVQVSTTAILAVGYLAVFASGIGFVVYFSLIERFGPLEVNLVTYSSVCTSLRSARPHPDAVGPQPTE
jgi:drug/metabolite transporter (DMT)-like permease